MAIRWPYDADLARAGVTVILTRGRGRITAAMCDEFPDLAVVGRCGAGLDNIDTVGRRGAGVAVVHARGDDGCRQRTRAAADAGLARRVDHARRAPSSRMRGSIREGYTGSELRGKRLGVVGLGAIGRRVAELGRALDMDVVYWSPSSRDDELRAARAGRAPGDGRRRPALRRPRSGHPPPDRRRRLALMKPTVLLVVTRRGAIVDHRRCSGR